MRLVFLGVLGTAIVCVCVCVLFGPGVAAYTGATSSATQNRKLTFSTSPPHLWGSSEETPVETELRFQLKYAEEFRAASRDSRAVSRQDRTRIENGRFAEGRWIEGSVAEPETPTFVFLHIHKTGGTTIEDLWLAKNFKHRRVPEDQRFWFVQNFDAQRVAKERRTNAAFDSVGMHIVHGYHALVGDKYFYGTMLREPASRTWSQYTYVKYKARMYWPSSVLSRSAGFDEFVNKFCVFMDNENKQTRYIGGPDAYVAPHPLHPRYLAKAKANLASMAWVGVKERFDESMCELGRLLGVEYKPLKKYNTTPPKEKMSKGDISRIAANVTQLDNELYEFALQLFESRLSDECRDAVATTDDLAEVPFAGGKGSRRRTRSRK